MSSWFCGWARRIAVRPLIFGRSTLLRTVAALSVVMPCDPVHAADWLIEGRGEIATEYDDNVFLDPDDEISAFGATVSPEIDIGGRGQVWDIFLTTRLDLARFTEEESLDSEDVTTTLNGNYRTELSELSFTGSFERLNTRTSEITDSGIVNAQATRTEYELSPSWTYRLTPRDRVIVSGGWNQAFFDTRDLDDFTAYSAGGGWIHELTQRDSLTLRGFYSHIENDDVDGNEADIVGGLLGWNRRVSERLETRIAVGPRYADVEIDTPVGNFVSSDSGSSLGILVDGMISYDVDERTNFSGRVSRFVEPSGIGAAVERDRVDLMVRHDLQPLIRISILGRYVESRDPNDDGAVRDRDYFGVRPTVRWEFERDWFISGSYRFRSQRFEGEDRAYSNAVFVTLSHRFQPWHFAD